MNILLTLEIVLLVSFASAQENLCPPTDSTAPCGCVSDEEDIRLDCVGVLSIADVRRGILSAADLDNVYIDFMLAKFDEAIPSHMFDGVKVRGLGFYQSHLKGIGDSGLPAFTGLDNILTELTVSFSLSEGERFVNLSNLQALEIFQYEGNDLDTFDDRWFQDGPTSLTHVYIMTNALKTLGKNAFAKLSNLQTIWVTNNKDLTEVSRSMFPNPAQELTYLDLGLNKLSSLPDDLFDNMPNLSDVDLVGNNLRTLPESTWSRVWTQLSRVYLNDNPLDCDEAAIAWILKLKRPNLLFGKCETPQDKNGDTLADVIDDHQIPDYS